MEWVVMEACAGLLASGTALQPAPDNGAAGSAAADAPWKTRSRAAQRKSASGGADSTAWHAWLEALLRAELAAAGLERGKMWAFAAAQGFAGAAGDAAGVSVGTSRLQEQLVDVDAAAATRDAGGDWVAARLREWTGGGLAEAKLQTLLGHSLDSCYKARPVKPKPC